MWSNDFETLLDRFLEVKSMGIEHDMEKISEAVPKISSNECSGPKLGLILDLGGPNIVLWI